DDLVTGVQTCALPISRTVARPGPSSRGLVIHSGLARSAEAAIGGPGKFSVPFVWGPDPCLVTFAWERKRSRSPNRRRPARCARKIGRASCRERVEGAG